MYAFCEKISDSNNALSNVFFVDRAVKNWRHYKNLNEVDKQLRFHCVIDLLAACVNAEQIDQSNQLYFTEDCQCFMSNMNYDDDNDHAPCF